MKIAFLHASLAFSAAALVASVPAFAQSAPQTILIGLAAPLTGPSARIGKDLQNGAQLAIDDANAKHPTIGGKPVVYKLVAADDQSDPRTAVAVAQQLVDQDAGEGGRGVHAVITEAMRAAHRCSVSSSAAKAANRSGSGRTTGS